MLVESIAVVLAAGVLLYFCVPWAYGRWSRRALRQLAVRRGRVLLTFDDGPGRRLTPAVLQLLAARNIKATFFLLGRNVQQNADIVRHIRAQGHEIGSHTYDHLHAWKVAPWRSVSDIRLGQKAIDDALGVSGGRYPFRPAYGKLNLITLLYLLAKRIPIVYWTVDSGDTWPKNRREGGRASDLPRRAGGGVVLSHDFDRGTNDADDIHQYVLETLRSALDTLDASGISSSTFSQLRGAPK
jgi:peptidoglycan-N-acetylglucosamine deacetylase